MMTERQALEETIKMWAWIKNETLKRKSRVGKDEYLWRYGKRGMSNNCYLCEYVAQYLSQEYPDDCYILCPITNWTGVKNKKLGYGICCERVDSPYLLWRDEVSDYDFEALAKYAGEIVRLAEDALRNLKD